MTHSAGRWAVAGVLFLLGMGVAADEKAIPGVGPAGEIKKVQTGFKFTEGPIGDGDGNVYFSDIPNEKIHKIDSKGDLSVFREKSNNANGLMINAKGEIVACEMTGAIVAISANGKDRRVITDKYDGKRYNAPNDLVLDKAGGVYFTDPSFRAPTPLPQTGQDVRLLRQCEGRSDADHRRPTQSQRRAAFTRRKDPVRVPHRAEANDELPG